MPAPESKDDQGEYLLAYTFLCAVDVNKVRSDVFSIGTITVAL